MNRIFWIRRIRRCVAVIAIVLALLVAFAAFETIRNSGDVQNVPGHRMRMRLGQFWPDGLQERFVTRGYVASDWSIDSSSTFIRFDADLSAIARWRAFLRTNNYASAVSLDKKNDRWCEVREHRCASIPLSSVTGEVPAWWNPTGDMCDAFETMVWYDQIDSGVGRGNYLQYDPNTSTAWVYSYSCQHDLLWDRGDGALVAIADTRKP